MKQKYDDDGKNVLPQKATLNKITQKNQQQHNMKNTNKCCKLSHIKDWTLWIKIKYFAIH